MQINGFNGQIKVVVIHKMFWTKFMILKDIHLCIIKQSNMIRREPPIENFDEEIELK